MKKILVFIIVALCGAVNVSAQETDSLLSPSLVARVDSLASKLNELQRDYDYLYCSHEISCAGHEIKALTAEFSSKSSFLLISSYHGSFNRESYDTSRDYYDVCENLLEVMQTNVDKKQELIAVKISVCDFSEREVDYLNTQSVMLDLYLEQARSALQLYKEALNVYYISRNL